MPDFFHFLTCSISDIKLLTKLNCSPIKARIWQILCFLISTGHSHGPGQSHGLGSTWVNHQDAMWHNRFKKYQPTQHEGLCLDQSTSQSSWLPPELLCFGCCTRVMRIPGAKKSLCRLCVRYKEVTRKARHFRWALTLIHEGGRLGGHEEPGRAWKNRA